MLTVGRVLVQAMAVQRHSAEGRALVVDPGRPHGPLSRAPLHLQLCAAIQMARAGKWIPNAPLPPPCVILLRPAPGDGARPEAIIYLRHAPSRHCAALPPALRARQGEGAFGAVPPRRRLMGRERREHAIHSGLPVIQPSNPSETLRWENFTCRESDSVEASMVE